LATLNFTAFLLQSSVSIANVFSSVYRGMGNMKHPAVLMVLAITSLVSRFGPAALAEYGIGARSEFLLMPLMFGIGDPHLHGRREYGSRQTDASRSDRLDRRPGLPYMLKSPSGMIEFADPNPHILWPPLNRPGIIRCYLTYIILDLAIFQCFFW
jgi:hypothetical protein